MRNIPIRFVLIVAIGLAILPGCKSLSKRDDFAALTTPVEYRLSASESAKPNAAEPDGILAKSAGLAKRTATFVAGTLLYVGVWAMSSWLDDDDDDDLERKWRNDWDQRSARGRKNEYR